MVSTLLKLSIILWITFYILVTYLFIYGFIGLIYLPEIKYRRILNQAFGPGGWALMPYGEVSHIQVGKTASSDNMTVLSILHVE